MTYEENLRHAYYCLRAMHDGACPNCGHIQENPMFCCPVCDFHITKNEELGIKKTVPQIMKRRVEGFKQIRDQLKKIGKG